MEDFRSTHIITVPEGDNGVEISQVIALAQSNDFYQDLADLLNINEIAGEFANIRGAKSLINSLSKVNDRFIKFNLGSDFHDIECFYGEDGQFYISFVRITDENNINIIENSEFTCTPIYASKSEFFKNIFSMHKFASSLTKDGHSDFVKSVLSSLKAVIKKGDHKRFYRVLRNKKDEFYLRAIVTDRYFDYSDNIAILLGIVGLHNETKKRGDNFYIQKASFNESYIKVVFTKEENKFIEGVGEVKYSIEVSNDELKREALRFTSASTIIYGKDKKELYIKPREAAWVIFSISHGTTPKTAISKLAELEKYLDQEEKIYEMITAIKEIKDPNKVRHLVYTTIDKSTTIKSGAKKDELKAKLEKTIDSMNQLFDILDQSEHLIEDIRGKEYLRFLFYDALIYRKNRGNEKGDNTFSEETDS